MSSAIVKADVHAIQKRIDEAKLKAEQMLCEQIINDTRSMVPTDGENHLRDMTKIETTEDGHHCVVWDTVYARYQWYGMRVDGTHVIKKHTTPGTTILWGPEAEKKYRNDWQLVAQNAFKKAMGGN